MYYQFDEESVSRMVCKDCLYRKCDRFIDGFLFEGYTGSACVKYLRKPSSIFQFGRECPHYTQQKEGEKLLWESEVQGTDYYYTMEGALERMRNEKEN